VSEYRVAAHLCTSSEESLLLLLTLAVSLFVLQACQQSDDLLDDDSHEYPREHTFSTMAMQQRNRLLLQELSAELIQLVRPIRVKEWNFQKMRLQDKISYLSNIPPEHV